MYASNTQKKKMQISNFLRTFTKIRRVQVNVCICVYARKTVS